MLTTSPNMLSLDVVERKESNSTVYVVDFSKTPFTKGLQLYEINMWFYSVLKILSCIVLTILTFLLCVELHKAEKRSARLKNQTTDYRRASNHPANLKSELFAACELSCLL